MTKKIFLYSIITITFFLLIGCNDSPTDLGVGFLNQDGIGVYKFNSSIDSMYQYSDNYKNVINLGSSDILLIGKAENVTAKTLLRFALIIPDSIKTEFTNQNLIVLDAYVELTKNYSFGDSAAQFDYEVYKINNSWSSSTFTADSNLSFDPIDLSSNRTNENDSVYSFHLDAALATSWIQNFVDTSAAANNGIILEPTPNSQKVLGFTAFNINGINDPRLRIVVQKPGSYIDTLAGFISADISAVYGDVVNTTTENLYIQSSLTANAKLTFDLSVLPKDITITSANLTLTIDTLETQTGSSYTNALIAFLLTDSVKNETSTSYYSSLIRDSSSFKGDVTEIFRAWNNNVENLGMLINVSSNLRGIEIYAVKGSDAANPADRPKLEIVYTRKK